MRRTLFRPTALAVALLATAGASFAGLPKPDDFPGNTLDMTTWTVGARHGPRLPL